MQKKIMRVIYINYNVQIYMFYKQLIKIVFIITVKKMDNFNNKLFFQENFCIFLPFNIQCCIYMR